MINIILLLATLKVASGSLEATVLSIDASNEKMADHCLSKAMNSFHPSSCESMVNSNLLDIVREYRKCEMAISGHSNDKNGGNEDIESPVLNGLRMHNTEFLCASVQMRKICELAFEYGKVSLDFISQLQAMDRIGEKLLQFLREIESTVEKTDFNCLKEKQSPASRQEMLVRSLEEFQKLLGDYDSVRDNIILIPFLVSTVVASAATLWFFGKLALFRYILLCIVVIRNELWSAIDTIRNMVGHQLGL